MEVKCQQHEDCDCNYCEYVNIQKSMISLPIKRSRSTIIMNVSEDCSSDSSDSVPKLPDPSPAPLPDFEMSILYQQWHTFLAILRLLGNCPLVLEDVKGSKGRKITVFHWFSWVSLYTLIVHGFRVGICVYYYKDWGYHILGRTYENKLEDWIIRCMNFALPLHQFWDLLMVWVSSKRGAELCNAWIDSETLYEQTFEMCYHYNSRIHKWRLILGILTATTFVGMTAGIAGEMFLADQFDPRRIIRIFPISFFVIMSVLDEVRVVLMYFTAAESFTHIGHAMKAQIKGWKHIPHEVVSKWTVLLQGVRNNVKLTGHVQAPQQIALFLHSILIFTGLLFITIQTLIIGSEFKILVIAALIANSFIVRIMMKIIIAENIVINEQKVADFLIELDGELLDLMGKLEVAKIIDVIQQKPSKISLNGYITIEKKMIPKMMGHVVAYLVVLIQFHLGYYVNKKNCPNETMETSSKLD